MKVFSDFIAYKLIFTQNLFELDVYACDDRMNILCLKFLRKYCIATLCRTPILCGIECDERPCMIFHIYNKADHHLLLL